MLIAEIDLNKNVTIVISTPDNKDEVGKVTQTVKQQAMKAEESGKDAVSYTHLDVYKRQG